MGLSSVQLHDENSAEQLFMSRCCKRYKCYTFYGLKRTQYASSITYHVPHLLVLVYVDDGICDSARICWTVGAVARDEE